MSTGDVTQRAAIEEIGRSVMARVGMPKDRWEIAAQLEVLGFRDSDARPRFGCKDLFETADSIFDLFQRGVLPPAFEADDDRARSSVVATFLRHYVKGLMFALPMVIQAATMLLWGFGLWGARDIDARTGSAIGLAFISSYIATSGFAWAIVSRGLYYFYQSEGALARWSALRMWSVAVRVTLAIAIPALLFNFLYRLLPGEMALIAAAYYAGLVLFWLNWCLMYLVNRTHWLAVILIVSIATVAAMVQLLGWPILVANLVGLAIADVLTFFVARHGLNRWARNGSGKPAVNPPRLTVLIYATAQVFLYGLLYSAFVFTDRLLAWTATRGREDFPPYAFWVNSRYELGMDLALVVVVILSGVVEFSTFSFSSRVVDTQKRINSSALQPFLDEFRRLYRRHALFLVVVAAAAVGIAALVLFALGGFPDERLQASLASTTTNVVFWVAAVSYAVFMYALLNILILMILSRADLAVRATAIALAVNVVAGFVLSRAVHYSGAIGGLLAGSIVLAVLSFRSIRDVLDELDYSYYAAF